MTIGIFGGTFDPIHNGHLEVARQALSQCALDEVWLMVSPENPLKVERKKTPEMVRLEIARVAVEECMQTHPDLKGRIKVSDFEFQLPRPSFTIQTLRALEESHPGTHFKWIAGGDNLRCLDRWRDADIILRDYGLIIYPRDTDDNSTPPPGVTILRDVSLLDVSSTQIRAATSPVNIPMPPKAARLWLNYHKTE